MPFIYQQGDMMSAGVEALVNTVNTEGVMGKGLALQFKETFPHNYKAYQKACRSGEVKTGKMFVTSTNQMLPPQYIINFPTKREWRKKSEYDYIQQGLDDLVRVIELYSIKSMAIPPLGCGVGGLDWTIVKKMIETKLSHLPNVHFIIFEPFTTTSIKSKEIKAHKKPQLTEIRAMLLYSLHKYAEMGYDLTLLEVQKIVYFLQRLGNDFKLTFERNHYGPYSNKLGYVLNNLDGHYLEGMGYNMAKPFDQIKVFPEFKMEIEQFMSDNFTDIQKESIEKLIHLIEGFESPLGMELLATVDFIVDENKDFLEQKDKIQEKIRDWNQRKAKLMRPPYITVTLNRLREYKDILYA
jgi:O-acetyl-ADP-ribose deacetylase (regulator of RNase III)